MSAPRFRLAHCSLAVRDIDVAIGFYRAAFGAELAFSDRDMTDLIRPTVGLPDVRCDLAQLTLPGTRQQIELIAFRDVPPGREDEAPVRVGHGHVCFEVDDLDAALAHVGALGAVPVGEIVGFPEGRAVYVREPAGSVIELEEIPQP
ncbi:VOC family protein [Patulibacter defluvii]|uniref:VOC family protein n=1 Tax=Patulibacter defluvii TaxID=3095358 RepID=UPI002A763C80|nr:VOC family protein [Patulibacter sp. DM4]